MKQSISLTSTPTNGAVINGAPIRAADPSLTTQLVPLTKLVVSKLNVRKHGPREIDSLAASIASKGLLQPLLVRPLDDKFEVVFGGRRTLALRKLNAAGHPDTDHVPCIVSGLDDAAAIAASLAENMERLPMDELDQYDAFAALIKQGQNEGEIASHFGVTEQAVKRRLALSRLIPEVKALYREGEIEEGVLQTLTLGAKDKQRAYVKECREGNPPPDWHLKEWLLGGSELVTTSALFPLEDYKAPVKTDLFGEASYFTNAEEFWALQNAAIANLKAELEGNGWEVEVVDPGNTFQQWNYEKRAKDKGGRAIVVVSANGEVATHKGLVHQDEARKAEKAKAADGKHGDGEKRDAVRQPELSEPLSNYIELVRHAAVRAALCGSPSAALRVAVAQVLSGSVHWRVSPERRTPMNATIAAATSQLATNAAFADAAKEAHDLLGKTAMEGVDESRVVCSGGGRTLAIYARLVELSDAEVLRVLAVAVAESLAVGTVLVDMLGAELKVDVAEGWRTDDGLLALVRDKEALSGMVTEVAGEDVAAIHLTAKGSKLRTIIGNAAKDKEGWVPRWMSFPQQGYSKRRLTKRAKLAA